MPSHAFLGLIFPFFCGPGLAGRWIGRKLQWKCLTTCKAITSAWWLLYKVLQSQSAYHMREPIAHSAIYLCDNCGGIIWLISSQLLYHLDLPLLQLLVYLRLASAFLLSRIPICCKSIITRKKKQGIWRQESVSCFPALSQWGICLGGCESLILIYLFLMRSIPIYVSPWNFMLIILIQAPSCKEFIMDGHQMPIQAPPIADIISTAQDEQGHV